MYRLPTKKDKVRNYKAEREQNKKESEKAAENSSDKVLNETKNLMQDLVKQMQELTKATKGNANMHQQQQPQQQQQRQYRGKNTVCYGCGVLGHMNRDCPQKVNNGGNRNHNAPSGTQGGRVQVNESNSSVRQPLN